MTTCIEKPPEWYWHSGLHDACITEVEMLEFPGYHGGKAIPNPRNCLILKINASAAMYDQTVQEIRLMNYEVLTKELSLPLRRKVWWLSDRLTCEEGRYTLDIDLKDLEADPEEFTFRVSRVSFDFAEVERR